MRREPFQFEPERANDPAWIEGNSLAELLNLLPARSPAPLGIAVRIVVQACHGVQAVHERCGSEGERVLGWVYHHRAFEGSFVAPELAPGERVEPSADVFALGAILYLLTTGRPPVLAASASKRSTTESEASAVPPSAVFDGYPRGLKKVVLRALSPQEDERFRSASEMLDALVAAFPGYASKVELAQFVGGLSGDAVRREARRAPQARERYGVMESVEASLLEVVSDALPDTLAPSQLAAPEAPVGKSKPSRLSFGAVAVAFVIAFGVTLVVSPPAATRRSAPAAPAAAPVPSLPTPPRVEPHPLTTAPPVALAQSSAAVRDPPSAPVPKPAAARRPPEAPTTASPGVKASTKSPKARPSSKTRDAVIRRYGI